MVETRHLKNARRSKWTECGWQGIGADPLQRLSGDSTVREPLQEEVMVERIERGAMSTT